jgi:hypothetical protein
LDRAGLQAAEYRQRQSRMTMETQIGLEHNEDLFNAGLACEGILSSQHTTFGKLVTLSLLRVQDTDEYFNSQLAQDFSPEAVSRVLRSRHERIFHDWLALNLEQQVRDVWEFFASYAKEGVSPPDNNLSLLIPSAASTAECALFFDDLAIVLALLDKE